MINDGKTGLIENVILTIGLTAYCLFWFSAILINEEWPKYNNEKVNFSQCVINLKARVITKEL